jgi:hypothetical protein
LGEDAGCAAGWERGQQGFLGRNGAAGNRARIEDCAENLPRTQEGVPQALKRGWIFKDLTARMNSCPSRTLLEVEFFPQVFMRRAAFLRRFAAEQLLRRFTWLDSRGGFPHMFLRLLIQFLSIS